MANKTITVTGNHILLLNILLITDFMKGLLSVYAGFVLLLKEIKR